MDSSGIWRSFVETGDPLCYLLARRLEQEPRQKNEKMKQRTEDQPRPLD